MTLKMLRIVSLLPSATEIVCALGLEDALVGVTHECDFPSSVAAKPRLTASRLAGEKLSSAEIDHAVRTQLDGHGSIYELDEQQLRALEPDLVLTQELCEVCAVNYKSVQQAARTLAANVLVISLEPNTIADIFANIMMVGELVSRKAEAKTLVARLSARLESIASRLSAVRHKPRTLMLEWLEPPFAPGHWVPEQVALAGGDQGFGRVGQPSVVTTAAEIHDYAPEVVVMIPCGYYKDEILRQLPRVKLPEGWFNLPAVKDNKVWVADATAYFSRPGPRVVDGVEILARILHPEIFGWPTEHEALPVSRELMINSG